MALPTFGVDLPSAPDEPTDLPIGPRSPRLPRTEAAMPPVFGDSATAMTIRTRRVYEPIDSTDGRRYLIDRLWPRGLRKEALALDGWLKELAPSDELRTWFGHDPARYPTFRERYRQELAAHPDLLDRLTREAAEGTVTLLFAARDTEHCNASVLRELLEERATLRPSPPRKKGHH